MLEKNQRSYKSFKEFFDKVNESIKIVGTIFSKWFSTYFILFWYKFFEEELSFFSIVSKYFLLPLNPCL